MSNTLLDVDVLKKENKITKYSQLIAESAEKIEKTEKTNDNIFLIRTANECIESAKKKPIPNCLFSEFWYEGELAVLFAGTGIGKTILAMQIANSISKGENIKGFKNESEKQKVLYFDFELSEKQFEKRYSNHYSNHYIFDNNFLKIEIGPDAEDFNEEIFYESIEKTILTTQAKILIIDNITYLKGNLETSKEAIPLMKKFKQFKKKYNLSILTIAHTPKRDLSRQININDLAGSMQLANFVDSIFTINLSAKDKSLRYIKQIKARVTEKIYDAENIIICELKNDSNFTFLDFIGFGCENEHIKQVSEDNKTEIENAIIELKKANPNYSLREIANELNTNQMKVKRILKKHEM